MSHLPFFKTNHFHSPFAMDTWDPIADMSPPHIPFHSRFGGGGFGWDETAEEEYAVRVDVPGLKREEVKVEVREGRFVKISGAKNVEREEKHENWHHAEWSSGNFSKVLTLPENSSVDHVRSCLENGVLTVTVPKRDVGKSHVGNGKKITID